MATSSGHQAHDCAEIDSDPRIDACCSQLTTESWVRIDLEQLVARANHLAKTCGAKREADDAKQQDDIVMWSR
jgi:hypothetical protein